MKELRAIPEPINHYEKIEQAINQLLLSQLYRPVMALLVSETNRAVLKNASSALLNAILAGRVNYYRGYFKGRISASISKELKALGAVWDRKQGAWKIPSSKLPRDVKMTISLADSKFQEKLKQVDKIISAFVPTNGDFKKQFEDTVYKVEAAYRATLRGITVAPVLNQQRTEYLAAEYSENMNLEIKKWSQYATDKLRTRVQERALAGQRYDGLADEIQKSYGVSRNKAKFLARQETSIFVAKYTEARYQDAGIDEYTWRCVTGTKNHPVRPMHRALNGKTFRWDQPPVVNEKGERKNPKCDYGCRCEARPIVRFK